MSEPTSAPAPVEPTTADVVKPVEPNTIAADESKPVEPLPESTATAPVDETAAPVATEAAATEDKPAETAAAAADAPVEPVSSGVLGYKAPGLIKLVHCDIELRQSLTNFTDSSSSPSASSGSATRPSLPST